MTNANSAQTQNRDFDVLVIGAGVSGLTGAQRLSEHGLRVAILEGRDRIGGRIWTVHNSSLEAPIELGAEFIHGASDEILDRFAMLGLTFYDVMDTHFRYGPDKRLHEMSGYWERLMRVLNKIDPRNDQTFLEFLKIHARDEDEETRRFLIAFVEGFHAANLDRLGTRGLAESTTPTKSLQDTQTFRPTRGYDRLLEGLLARASTSPNALHLNTIAKDVIWRKGHVEVQATSTDSSSLETFRARAAIVTIPLGVLKAPPDSHAALRFNPEPPTLMEALSHLEMGHALRLILRFRHRLWEDASDEPIGFLHAGPDRYFPTWWTTMPVRAPLITAWQGGPKALEISAMSEERKIATAMDTLSALIRVPITRIKEDLQAWYFHDWSKDPFSLGAYSFAGVGGTEASLRLSEPIDDTLFFAGEATHSGPARGTVDGAIASGERAAALAMKILRS